MKYYRHRSSGAIKAVKTINEFSMPSNWERVHVLPDWTPNTPETRPPVGEVVIVYKSSIRAFNIDTDKWMGEDEGWDAFKRNTITHWMPCPDLPEKAKSKRIEKLQIDNSLSVVQRSTRSKINEIIERMEGEK